jgi:drug/metabolite transporter (DMT)-like permease
MWLYILAFFVLIVGIVGTVFSGGIFTIVLVPLGIIAVITAAVFGAFGRAAQGREGASTDAKQSTGRPLPTGHNNAPSPPSSPEDLTEARRVQQ